MTKYRLTLDSDGRLAVPDELRRRLGLEPGESVIVDLDGDTAYIQGARRAMEEARDMVRPCLRPGETVVDDFLRDRRGAGD